MRRTFFLVTICLVIAWFFLVFPFMHLHSNGVDFKGNPVSASETTQTAPIREKIFQNMLVDFQHLYFVDPELRGKTYKIMIKDFALDDEETYAITDEDSRFWVIALPTYVSGSEHEGCIYCKPFSLDHVRKDLVTSTRDKGLQFQFTVPVREEDLPGYKP